MKSLKIQFHGLVAFCLRVVKGIKKMCNKDDQLNTKTIMLEDFKVRKSIQQLLKLKEKEIKTEKIENSKKLKIDGSVWDALGIYFLKNCRYYDALAIYKHMLTVIKETENSKGCKIHKGMPLHNIGICQINLGNFDEGIPNVLRAFEEDVDTFGETKAKSMVASKVYTGITDSIIKIIDTKYLTSFVTGSGVTLTSSINLFRNMTENEKLFFAKILKVKESCQYHDDDYSIVTLFDNLKNLCLLLEYNLKRRSGRPNRLGGLIQHIFASDSWNASYIANRERLTSYDDNDPINDFNNKLAEINRIRINSHDDFLLVSFLTIHLLRNLTSHNFDPSLAFLLNQSTYDLVFQKLIDSVLYSLHYTI